jgi:hypothetical protein
MHILYHITIVVDDTIYSCRGSWFSQLWQKDDIFTVKSWHFCNPFWIYYALTFHRRHWLRLWTPTILLKKIETIPLYSTSQFFDLLNLHFIQSDICRYDEVAEWLRRWTANPMGSARVGSNPIFVDIFSLHMGKGRG